MASLRDTYSAAAAVCRAGSIMFGPYAPDWTWMADDAQTVTLPEPEELTRLLASPQWSWWWQPDLFAGVA